MKIELKSITVRELVDSYQDRADDGVSGYGGLLDIRPPYQREFIYKEEQRNAVIRTVVNSYPLNVMYWSVRNDGTFEVIDGQQRTISLCQYVDGIFSFEGRYFHNLQSDEKEHILNYNLMVYLCTGTDTEKLSWFQTINIAGVKLTDQEMLNAVFSGSWVTDAKRYFSKTNCVAKRIGGDYLIGAPNRQEFLETAISWISHGAIKDYMAVHQHDTNATELWEYFQRVINWVKETFTVYRKEMKGIEWGELYNTYNYVTYNPADLELRILTLIDDDEVQNVRGIYRYLLTGKERHLSLRQFSDKTRRRVYEQQNGICPICNIHFTIEEMEADHITPWHEGGKTIDDNCQMLCKDDNRRKSGK